MDSKLLSQSELRSYAAPVQSTGLLSPSQLKDYATKNMPSNPSSNIGSSWDSYDKALKDQNENQGYKSIMSQGPLASPLSKVVPNIASDLYKRGQNVIEDVSNVPKNTQEAGGGVVPAVASTLSAAGHVAGEIAGGTGDIIGEFISPFIPKPVKDKIGDVSKYVSDKVDTIPGMTPEIKKGLGDVFNAVSLLGGKKAIPEAKNIASDVSSLAIKAKEAIIPEAKPLVIDESKITDLYNRSIKPSVSGKSNATQVSQANNRAVSGLKTIAENKPTLQFSDAEGNIIKGELPKSVDQLSQSIQQTKRSIFEQYDALAKEAGEKGITVDAPKIAEELKPVIESKSLQIANPSAIQYAKDLQSRLINSGQIDAKTSQEIVQHYNDSLKAFYRNPSYDTASKASIDAMIANKFRDWLDTGISEQTGTRYQALKNKYGALSSMEKDVSHRNVVWGRQNQVSLASNLSNIASGAELVKGLITLNPADLAASVAIKGIQKYVKYLNNPDVGVAKIFSEIENKSKSVIAKTPSAPFVPKSQTVKTISSAIGKYKSIPSKEGGFVKIGGKTFSQVSEATKKEMIQAIDYLRIGKQSKGVENSVSKLAQKFNISEDLSNEQIAKKFEDLVENTKTVGSKEYKINK